MLCCIHVGELCGSKPCRNVFPASCMKTAGKRQTCVCLPGYEWNFVQQLCIKILNSNFQLLIIT